MRVTILQSDLTWEDKSANLHQWTEKLAPLAGTTDIIVLPEMFTTGFSMRPEVLAETMDGDSIAWMAQQAAATGAAITGSIIIEEGGKYYNRLIWMYPNGQHLHYDKRHLFSFGSENDHYTHGNKRLICEWKGWKICPLICYDLRFPVWSRNNEGYDLLIYIANWPDRRRLAWKTLLAARAIENLSYCIGVNRVGTDGTGLIYAGDSAIHDPLGETLFAASDQEATFTTTLSKPLMEDFRSKFTFLNDQDPFQILA